MRLEGNRFKPHLPPHLFLLHQPFPPFHLLNHLLSTSTPSLLRTICQDFPTCFPPAFSASPPFSALLCSSPSPLSPTATTFSAQAPAGSSPAINPSFSACLSPHSRPVCPPPTSFSPSVASGANIHPRCSGRGDALLFHLSLSFSAGTCVHCYIYSFIMLRSQHFSVSTMPKITHFFPCSFFSLFKLCNRKIVDTIFGGMTGIIRDGECVPSW